MRDLQRFCLVFKGDFLEPARALLDNRSLRQLLKHLTALRVLVCTRRSTLLLPSVR